MLFHYLHKDIKLYVINIILNRKIEYFSHNTSENSMSRFNSLDLLFQDSSCFSNSMLQASYNLSFFVTSSLLLLLAGDVSLNLGPTSSSNLNVYSYNIRSARSTSNNVDKPV